MDVINYSFQSNFTNLIYSFQNDNYFFEFNLINILNYFQNNKYRFLYLNINKINKIFNNKYLFKKYIGYWISKLFQDFDENINNKLNYINFINDLMDSIFKNKQKYLEIILDKLNNKFLKTYEKDVDNRFNFKDNILIILNNINVSDVQWIEKIKFCNLQFLFIFNIQNNFDIFQFYYYEPYKLKKIKMKMKLFIKTLQKKIHIKIFIQYFNQKMNMKKQKKN